MNIKRGADAAMTTSASALGVMAIAVCALMMLLAVPVAAQEELTIYSHRHYPVDKDIFARFEEQNDVKIRVLQAHADELIERIVAEGERTEADLFLAVSVLQLERAVARGILAPVRSGIINVHVPATLRHPRGYWTGLTTRARVIVYNPAVVEAHEVARYRDLALSKWRGRIAVRTSAHVYNLSFFSGLLSDNGAEFARAWVDGFAGNFARSPRGNDRDQIRAVMNGQADIALVNSYYYGLMASASEDAEGFASSAALSFPDQDAGGAYVDVSGIGVVVHSRQRALARRLIEFLTSRAQQRLYANENYEFPVNARTEVAAPVAAWQRNTLNYEAIGALADHRDEALRILDASDWD